MNILFIFPRRGLFQLTVCNNCSHQFECRNCSANLVTYKSIAKYELICHHCQTSYPYPEICPKCKSQDIISKYSGVEDLYNLLTKKFQVEVNKLYKDINKTKNQPISPIIPPLPPNLEDNNNKKAWITYKTRIHQRQYEEVVLSGQTELYLKDLVEYGQKINLYLTTRVFDPSLDYNQFEIVIYVKAENLIASADYLVQEEVVNSICKLQTQLQREQTIIYDTNNPQISLIKELSSLGQTDFCTYYNSEDEENYTQINSRLGKFYDKFLQKEYKSREKYFLPPYYNLLLITVHDRKDDEARLRLTQLYEVIKKYEKKYEKLIILPPYPAKLHKRKGYYSYHFQIKYPRNYPKYLEFKKLIQPLIINSRMQARINPRHVF